MPGVFFPDYQTASDAAAFYRTRLRNGSDESPLLQGWDEIAYDTTLTPFRHTQNRRLVRQIEVAASVWNHCIALHRRYYRLYGKSLNVNRLQKHLTKLKKQPRFVSRIGSGSARRVAGCMIVT